MMTDNNIVWRFRNQHEDLGQFGERLWGSVFNGCGYFYVPLCKLPAMNGKGPRLQGNDTILPDFEIVGGVADRRRAYADSKAKTGPVLFKIANHWRHGIDLRNFKHYETISGINRQKCILAIVEIFTDENCPDTWSGALLVQTLGRLGPPAKGFSTQAHMVYWGRSLFQEIARLAPMDMWKIAAGTQRIGDELKRGLDAFYGLSEKPIQARMF